MEQENTRVRGEWGAPWVTWCLQACREAWILSHEGERSPKAFGMDQPDLFVFVLSTKVRCVSSSIHSPVGRSQSV